MRQEKSTGHSHFLFLDGLRGLAAIAVLIGHLKQTEGQAQAGNFGMAVDLFFILSGFVVMHAYGERVRAGMRFGAFAMLRIVRLYPMLVAGTMAGLALALARAFVNGEPGLAEVGAIGLLGLLCLPVVLSEGHEAAFPLNPPQWSLFFEFAANFLFASLGRHIGPFVCWAFAATGAAFLILTSYHYGHTDTGSTQETLSGGLARVLFGFFCGAGLYMLPRLASLGLPAGIGIVVFLTAALWPWWDAPIGVRLVLIVLCLPLTIQAGASVLVSGRIAKLCGFLGVISYPLYIIHAPVLGVTSRMIATFDPDGTYQSLWIAAHTVFFIALSWAAVKLYDGPARTWLSRRLAGGPRQAAQSPGR